MNYDTASLSFLINDIKRLTVADIHAADNDRLDELRDFLQLALQMLTTEEKARALRPRQEELDFPVLHSGPVSV